MIDKLSDEEQEAFESCLTFEERIVLLQKKVLLLERQVSVLNSTSGIIVDNLHSEINLLWSFIGHLNDKKNPSGV